MSGGFVDAHGQLWPTCPQCGKTHACVELPGEQAEQIETWRRGLAEYSHRSDSSGYAGRMGEEVLNALFRARLANIALSIAYRRGIEKRLELRRVLQEQGYLIKTVTGEMVWHAWDCTGGYDFVECIPRCKQGRDILAATEGGE